MVRLVSILAGLLIIAATANAQTYRCEYGELVGGQTGVSAKCTVNSAGQITSVTPYETARRDRVTIYRSGQIANVPARSYKRVGERAHRPAPLKPLRSQPVQAFSERHSYSPGAPSAYPTEIVRTVSHDTISRPAHRRNIITPGTPPNVQRSALATPCTFKIREVPANGNNSIYEVCYSDIGNNDPRSLRKLYSRIKRASRRACGTDYDSILTRWSASNARCVDANVDRAVMTSGLDPLRAYHLARTGKGTPTVYVGAPRDG